MNLYEILGRKVEEAEHMKAEREMAINVISALKRGERSLDEISLLPDGGFQLVPVVPFTGQNGHELEEKVPEAIKE